ncbi:MAG: CBS domain-containing protein [Nitrospinae bacterium]|nr:CBS domain-containing protein [Nitrospinota bacterium]
MGVRVRDVMIRDVVTIDGAAPLMEGLDLMIKRSVKSLVIPPKADGDAFGILTFTDIARKVIAADERLEMLNIFDVMTKPCITVAESLDIRFAARMMTTLSLSRLIVTDGKTLQGIVSMTDLVRSLVSK